MQCYRHLCGRRRPEATVTAAVTVTGIRGVESKLPLGQLGSGPGQLPLNLKSHAGSAGRLSLSGRAPAAILTVPDTSFDSTVTARVTGRAPAGQNRRGIRELLAWSLPQDHSSSS